jgi:hypothetical protein
MPSDTPPIPHDDPPPPVRAGPAKPVALIACGVILAGLLLVVVMNLERSGPQETRGGPDVEPPDVTELITPGGLSAEDLAGDGFDIATDTSVDLPAGGWIQITDDAGNLAQQYRFERLDPRPTGRGQGWLQMVRPEAEIYLSGGRVITLSGANALAFAPNRALESGTIFGDVLIRLFEPAGEDDDDTPVDTVNDRPAVIVRTDEARFDNMLGEIACPGWITVNTPSLDMPGEGLRVYMNDRDGTFRLELDAVEHIELVGVEGVERRGEELAAAEPLIPDEPGGEGDVKPAPATKQAAGEDLSKPDREDRRRERRQRRRDRRAAELLGEPIADGDAVFYRLTLRDTVRIEQTTPDGRRTLGGDELTVVFSPRNEGIDMSLAWYGPTPAPVPLRAAAVPRPATTLLAASALATAEYDLPYERPDVTIITCEGGMTIVPLESGADRPPTRDEAIVELVGAPVSMTDEAENALAVCASMRYETAGDAVDLVGSPRHPVHLDTPQLAAGGARFRYGAAALEAGFVGAGWLEPRRRPALDLDRLAEAFGGAVQVPPTVWLLPDHLAPVAPAEWAAAQDETDDPLQGLRVTWTDGVDLDLAESTRGDAGADQPSHLRAATFRGAVLAESRGESMGADELELALDEGDDGRPVPRRLTAAGNVRVSNADQTVWGDDLEVTFVTDATTVETDTDTGGVDVGTLTATGDVQVLLADGTRAFADELLGDAQQETIRLGGEDVSVVSGRLLIRGGRELTMRRDDGKARWNGPGEARIHADPLVVDEPRRVGRPSLDDPARPVQVTATWTDSMLYDSLAHDEAGALHLRGGVDVVSTPNELEYNHMTGAELTLEFTQEPATDAGTLAGDVDPADGHGRRLARMIAAGDAKLENRAWLQADHADVPRVFYVSGERVEYDDLTREAVVPSAGELLIRDLRQPPGGEGDIEPAPAPDAGPSSFSGRGTTLFRWQDSLRMSETSPDRFRIVMAGAIQVLHRDLAERTATLSTDRLEADVFRQEKGTFRISDDGDEKRNVPISGEGEEKRNVPISEEAMFDVGGPMQLAELRAEGGVLVRTDARDVSCHAFDYDEPTGMSRLSGRVSILDRATGSPIRAERVLWNMKRDTLTILEGEGAFGR